MKFRRELERTAIQEWQPKYFNYKAVKKLIKRIKDEDSNCCQCYLRVADGEFIINDTVAQDGGDLNTCQDGNGNPSTAPCPNRDEYRQSKIFPATPPSPYSTGQQGDKISRRSDYVKTGTNTIADGSTNPATAFEDITQQYHEYDCGRQFRAVLDKLSDELRKVDTFYEQLAEQAETRLELLEQQLREMRRREMNGTTSLNVSRSQSPLNLAITRVTVGGTHNYRSKVNIISEFWHHLSESWERHGSRFFVRREPRSVLQWAFRGRDYTSRSPDREVMFYGSQRTAKRRLRLALRELYRSLELLKTYSSSNKTAFQKSVKKLVKAVMSHRCNDLSWREYMDANEAPFMDTSRLDRLSDRVIDLYAQYCTNGNRKTAAKHLRDAPARPWTLSGHPSSGPVFRGGLLIGAGLVLVARGLANGNKLLRDEDTKVRLHTAYLLQIYGGFALFLWIGFLFCIDCCLWTAYKINYAFILELDARSQLSWQHLVEFLSVFVIVLGVLFWLNMSVIGSTSLYLWYPVILLGAYSALLCLPLPILYPLTRKWLWLSHYRLFLAGIFPVEFRDILLGDIYCSLTYATANIELFFCLYTRHWANPPVCNSNQSRLMGFFTTVPGLWRSAQCIRRFRDTGCAIPHLVNLGKYACTVLSYVTLSLYRIDGSTSNLGILIVFNLINAIYCSIWDIVMDMGLLQSNAIHTLLRDTIVVRRPWFYYSVMGLNTMLRFSWILYAIFTHGTAQHSSFVSFIVAFAEVSRRGMWIFLRVENEHCINIKLSRASRDVLLPYHINNELEQHTSE